MERKKKKRMIKMLENKTAVEKSLEISKIKNIKS